MCGIIALIGKGNITNELLKINHRGLDTTKILSNNDITIGFNRLAINDKTKNGEQPFEYGNFAGVFNGEVYNAEKLRTEFNLKTNSNSDTEVILPLFEKFGSSVIQHLDGFYSGIIYNKITRQLFLLRDYIGKKPLFFVKTKNANYIVSELKATDFADNFQIIPKGFSELSNNRITLLEEHKISFIPKSQIKETLIEAVIKRIPQKEKQFGVFLSGGLDSSIIASIVSKYADNVIYYTLGNTGDLEFVNKLAKRIGIEAKIKKIALPLQKELLKLIEKVVYHTESYNPSIISNGLATFLLSKEAKKDGLKVILTGEGADELFCGYKIPNRFEKRNEFIENMHFTECRRLDMASMAHTIEVRCPFLDKQVYAISNNCTENDLIDKHQGKQILRKAFTNDLPNEIISRNKVSFDVGSGIRKMVVKHLTKDNLTEKESLKKIWCKYFQNSLSDNLYFHSYPTFDKLIIQRGVSHKISIVKKIENLLLKEFKTVPFHNIFMLNNKHIVVSDMGGTCSDKTLHFKKVLIENSITSKLHSAFINEIECHRMLLIEINKKKYFIDPGSGWVNPKLIPAFKEIEYSTFGMSFKTQITEDNLLLFHKTNKDFKLMIRIPLISKSENEILLDIEKRFCNVDKYPFKDSLRFSKVIDNSFYFIKGNKLKIYSKNGIREQILSKSEIKSLIENTFNFNLEGLHKWYTPNQK